MEGIAPGMVEIANRHRPAGNEYRHRAHCKERCRAPRSNPDVPVANGDQKPDDPGEISVDRACRHEGVGGGEAWQAGRICDGWVERLGAGHVVLHRTVGQESNKRHK